MRNGIFLNLTIKFCCKEVWFSILPIKLSKEDFWKTPHELGFVPEFSSISAILRNSPILVINLDTLSS